MATVQDPKLQQLLQYLPIFVNTAMSQRPTHNYSTKPNGTVLRHPQFHRDLGAHSVTVENVGWFINSKGEVDRYPDFLYCDPLAGGIDMDGLMPTSGLIYSANEMLTTSAFHNGRLIKVVKDAHIGPHHVNHQALTGHLLTVDYYLQLRKPERDRADRYFSDKMEIPARLDRENAIRRSREAQASAKDKLMGQRWLAYAQKGINMPDDGQDAQYLTVNEVKTLLGESPDGEFRDFLFPFSHCVEKPETGSAGLYAWVPFLQDLFLRVQHSVKQARKQGETAPKTRLLSFHKNDLRPNVGNGLRGTSGNLLEEALLASQYGMPAGPAHDHLRKLSVYGMGTPYTALYAIMLGFALGFRVRLHMDCTFNFDRQGISMIELVRLLRHLMPDAFEASIGWDADWMGDEEPVDAQGRRFNDYSIQIKANLEQQHSTTGGAGLNQLFYANGDPKNAPVAVIKDLTV